MSVVVTNPDDKNEQHEFDSIDTLARYIFKLQADNEDLQRELHEAFDDVEREMRKVRDLNEAGLKLQAENERLLNNRNGLTFSLDEKLCEEISLLQAENERLRKAGDGLMFEGETMAHEVSWNPAPWDRVVAAWVAAKEGRDAK